MLSVGGGGGGESLSLSGGITMHKGICPQLTMHVNHMYFFKDHSMPQGMKSAANG